MNNQSKFGTRRVVRIAIFGALSAVLYFIPGIPIIPPIYKLDFSTIPVLTAALLSGPVDAVIALLIKDLTGLLHSSSMGVGELADFICSGVLTLTAYFICGKIKLCSAKKSVLALLSGIIAMTIAGAFVNYYIMIPFYVDVFNMPLDSIVGMIGKVIPAVTDLNKLIMYATCPFNLLKGIVISILAYLISLRISKERKLDVIFD